MEAPSRIDFIQLDELERAGGSLSTALRSLSHIHFRQYGPGGIALISSRGGNSSQTDVLLGGISITNPQLGQVDASIVDVLGVEAVEVITGAHAGGVGTGAAGGRIELLPYLPSTNQATAHLSSGSFGTRGGGLSIGSVQGPVKFLVAGRFSRSDGDFEFLNEAAFPSAYQTRKNADHTASGVVARLATIDGRSTVSFQTSQRERGLPGVAGGSSFGERQEDRSRRVWMSHDASLGLGSFQGRAMYQSGFIRYKNPVSGVDDTGKSNLATAVIRLAHPFGPHTFSMGLRGEFADVTHPAIPSSVPSRQTYAINLEGEIASRRVVLYPGVNADVRSTGKSRGVSLSPRVGANVRVDNAARIRSSAGRVQRIPSFNDLYWRSAGARGNPDLKPEDGWTTDVGVLIAPTTNLLFDVSIFFRSMSNQIVWSTDIGGLWTPQNVARTRAFGADLVFDVPVTDVGATSINGKVTYSFVSVVDMDRTQHRQLRYTPRQKANASVGVRRGGLKANATVGFTGTQNVTAGGSERLPAFLTSDMGVGFVFPYRRHHLSLIVDVHNLFNARYAVVQNYPMPLRNYSVKLLMQFNGKNRKQ